MTKKNEIIFNLVKHRKCYKIKKGNICHYSLNSLKIQVPAVIGNMMDDLVNKKAYRMLKELIVIHKDKFHTNFED